MSTRPPLLTRLGRLFRGDSAPPAVVPQGGVPVDVSIESRGDSWFNALTGLGGVRDKGAAARPDVYQQALTYAELTAIWRFGGLGRRIVTMFPDEALRAGWDVVNAPDDDPLMAEYKRLQLAKRLHQGLCWGRLYGLGTLLIVTDEDVPPEYQGARRHEWLRTPLNTDRLRRVVALHALDWQESRPFTFDGRLSSPNFRQPTLWSVNPSIPVTDGGLSVSGVIHESRLIRLGGAELPPSQQGRAGWGLDDSCLDPIFQGVRNYGTINQALATLAQEIHTHVLKLPALASKKTGGQRAAFLETLGLMNVSRAFFNAILLGPNDEWQTVPANVSGTGDLSDRAREYLSAVTGIPQTKLFGSAPGGLNTDGASGTEQWNRQVSTYQARAVKPALLRLNHLIYAAQQGPTGGEVPENLDIVFRPLDEPPALEVADRRLKIAQRDAVYVTAGVLSPEEVRQHRFVDGNFDDEIKLEPERSPEDAALEAFESMGLAGLPLSGSVPPQVEEPTPRANSALELARRLDSAPTPDSLVFMVPITGEVAALVKQIRTHLQKLLPDLDPEPVPHVTLLYLGGGDRTEEELREVIPRAHLALRDQVRRGPAALSLMGLGWFPASPGEEGEPGPTPIFARVESWCCEQMNRALLASLAHLVRAPQHLDYRPHLTLGYLPRGLTTAEADALSRLEVSAEFTSGVVELWQGDEVAARFGLLAPDTHECGAGAPVEVILPAFQPEPEDTEP